MLPRPWGDQRALPDERSNLLVPLVHLPNELLGEVSDLLGDLRDVAVGDGSGGTAETNPAGSGGRRSRGVGA